MTGDMAIWQQILLGVFALLALFVFWPGVKVAMQKSEQAEEKDWAGVLLPIGIVILFVIFLIVVN